MENIRDLVYNYTTKHKEGFTFSEIKKLLEQLSNINKEKFNNALVGCTCMLKDNDTIVYHSDIFKALKCGIENRDLYINEWD